MSLLVWKFVENFYFEMAFCSKLTCTYVKNKARNPGIWIPLNVQSPTVIGPCPFCIQIHFKNNFFPITSFRQLQKHFIPNLSLLIIHLSLLKIQPFNFSFLNKSFHLPNWSFCASFSVSQPFSNMTTMVFRWGHLGVCTVETFPVLNQNTYDQFTAV